MKTLKKAVEKRVDVDSHLTRILKGEKLEAHLDVRRAFPEEYMNYVYEHRELPDRCWTCLELLDESKETCEACGQKFYPSSFRLEDTNND